MDLQIWLDALKQVNSSDVQMAWMAGIGLGISGISALAGLFGNKKQQQQQKSTTNINELTAPEYDDKQMYMRNYLMDQYLDRTKDQEDYFGGYTREGLGNINRTADAGNRAIENLLASRGLSGTSAGASAQTQGVLNRLGQQSSFLNQIPQMRDQRERQNMLDAGGFFGSLPVAQRRTGTNTTEGTVTTPGNQLGGAIGSLGTSLAGMYGLGAFGKLPSHGTAPTNTWAGYNPKPINYKLG